MNREDDEEAIRERIRTLERIIALEKEVLALKQHLKDMRRGAEIRDGQASTNEVPTKGIPPKDTWLGRIRNLILTNPERLWDAYNITKELDIPSTKRHMAAISLAALQRKGQIIKVRRGIYKALPKTNEES